MERKETKRSILQVMRYILNRKDCTKRNRKKPSCRWWCHIEDAVCAWN